MNDSNKKINDNFQIKKKLKQSRTLIKAFSVRRLIKFVFLRLAEIKKKVERPQIL